jgi:hypothetical protein
MLPLYLAIKSLDTVMWRFQAAPRLFSPSGPVRP